VIGLPNLCYAFGITIPDLKIVTVVLTLALWYFRRRFRPEDILPILILMSVTFLVAHDYDVVVLVPVLIAFWRHLARHPREALIALGLAFLLILPDQVVARTGVPWLYQRCTVVVLILLGWLLRLSRQTPTETGPQLEPQTAPAAGP
jgi:hypothetical protein